MDAITTADRKESVNINDEHIPQEIWDIIPPCGNYLKNIMQFSGYVREESILKLKDKNELEKMFSFVRSMSEFVEDKRAVFGIFEKNPDKLTILPGLESTFIRFIDAVGNLNSPMSQDAIGNFNGHISHDGISDSSNPVSPYGLENLDDFSPKRAKREDKKLPISIDPAMLSSRMEIWISKQRNYLEHLAKFGIQEAAQAFSFIETTDPPGCYFLCNVCKREIRIQNAKGQATISNPQRHVVKNCWLRSRKNDSSLPAKLENSIQDSNEVQCLDQAFSAAVASCEYPGREGNALNSITMAEL